MNKSIFQITQERISLLNQLEALEGDLTEIQETWEGNKAEIALKVESYLQVINSTDNDIEAINVAIKRLQDVKERKQKLKERLRENLKFAVDKFGTIEVKEGDLIGTKLYLRESEKVVVEQEKLDLSYISKTVILKPYMAKIKEALKAGKKVAGASLEKSKSLVIK